MNIKNNQIIAGNYNLKHIIPAKPIIKVFYLLFFLMPVLGFAQVDSTVKKDTAAKKDTIIKKDITVKKDTIIKKDTTVQKAPVSMVVDSLRPNHYTQVKGKITDLLTGKPVIFVRVNFVGSKYGTNSNEQGNFDFTAPGVYRQAKFSLVGYKTVIKTLVPGEVLNLQLESTETQLKEVVIKSARRQKYRNKGNPSVELIQQVIDHKEQNKPQDVDYLQYDEYERMILSLVDLSPSFLHSAFFTKYRFLLDTTQVVNGKNVSILPAYMAEKYYHNYLRKDPAKSISIMAAHKEVDFGNLIDPKGFDIYLNRFYGNVDMYSNNIFIVTNQFLSPIADHSPNYYKFFITDTVQSGNEKLIEISFVPRNRGDLLFEGKLFITMDGNYAVKAADMKIDKQINLNFLRLLQIHQDFQKSDSGKYYLTKSTVKADFGILKNKGFAFSGERTLNYRNYKLHSPQPPAFYDGASVQTAPDTIKKGPDYWAQTRGDTLNPQQAKLYKNIDSLNTMPSFRRTAWIARLLAGGYGDVGPFQFGPIDATYTFNYVEGSRFRLGGRSTPAFNKNIYLEGYGAYGFRDNQYKGYLSAAWSFNQTAPYLYLNNYIKVGYQYDTDIPGQNFLINRTQSFLGSFKRGDNTFWLYNNIFKVDYVRDFENHISVDVGFKNWQQRPAGDLVYETSDPINPQPINKLTTSEFGVLLRYAPHEKFLQGTIKRYTIPSKYPIMSLSVNTGVKGLVNGQFNYVNASANIYKRFYLSQLGYTDITLQGGMIFGQVPFPLLSILPANQAYLYDKNAYNVMNFLEFVSDHYVGLNLTHNFGGFFLNKIPVIESFKLREIVSFKILYGGVRDENNPNDHANLYKFPTFANGTQATYALGNTPYIEGGVGIGNIYKALRFDVVRRFNYLDHPGIAPWALKVSFVPDL